MDPKVEKQMKKMVEAVQPYCDEEILAAMTCSHAGSMRSVVASKFLGGIGAISKTSELPNPVFIAVGKNTIYAFKYKPWFLNFKIKKEVARWLKGELEISSEQTPTMCYFALTLKSGETYPMEIATFMGGQELAQEFLKALSL